MRRSNMADAHAQRAQAIAPARIQFLSLIHGGTTEAERTTPLISLDALAEHEDSGSFEAALRDEGDCFADVERTLMYEALYAFIRALPYSQRELIYLIYW